MGRYKWKERNDALQGELHAAELGLFKWPDVDKEYNGFLVDIFE